MDAPVPAVSLDRSQFTKTISLLAIQVLAKLSSKAANLLKGYVFNWPRLRHIIPSPGNPDKRLVLLAENVKAVDNLPPSVQSQLQQEGFLDVVSHTLTLDYSYWSTDHILRQLLPAGAEVPSAFETVGHIAHLNLRDELLPFRHLIGQVILDKHTPRLRSVVNKRGVISSQFRVPEWEVLAGQSDLTTSLRQHGCLFHLDFATVYWNSRLEAEHKRIVTLIKPNEVVVDIFAGIGPFAIPAARQRRAFVFANDLNPQSAAFLRSNAVANACEGRVRVSCCDAREFVKWVMRAPQEEGGEASGGGEAGVDVVMQQPSCEEERGGGTSSTGGIREEEREGETRLSEGGERREEIGMGGKDGGAVTAMSGGHANARSDAGGREEAGSSACEREEGVEGGEGRIEIGTDLERWTGSEGSRKRSKVRDEGGEGGEVGEDGRTGREETQALREEVGRAVAAGDVGRGVGREEVSGEEGKARKEGEEEDGQATGAKGGTCAGNGEDGGGERFGEGMGGGRGREEAVDALLKMEHQLGESSEDSVRQRVKQEHGRKGKKEKKEKKKDKEVMVEADVWPDAWRHVDHVIMNLPASAVTFLDSFQSCLSPTLYISPLPLIHCYTFLRGNQTTDELLETMASHLGAPIPSPSIHTVRNVAPNKDMLCVSFRLPERVAFGDQISQ